MNSRCLALLPLVVLPLVPSRSVGATADMPTVRAHQVPDSFQPLRVETAAALPYLWRDAIIWPDADKIRIASLPVTKTRSDEAVDPSLTWLRTVLQPQWVPDRSNLVVHLLRADLVGADAIRFRYQLDQVVFQVASTSCDLVIAILQLDSTNSIAPVNETGARDFLTSRYKKFLQHSDRVATNSLKSILPRAGGFLTESRFAPRSFNRWWGHLTAWTDGRVVLIGTLKTDGGPIFPTTITNWLSAGLP